MERRGRAEGFWMLLVCWLVVGPVLAQVRHPLPVLWMMPISSGSGRENLTAAVAPAVRLALQDLKRQPPPLGNYEIQLQLLDSQCDPAKSLKALFDAMWAGPEYLLVFGGVCPPVTALVARSLPAFNLVQVSFAASSPSLSNRKWYGNLFSTVPSDRALNQATVKLLQRFRWTRVGIITQEGARLSEMKQDLIRQLLKADVQVVSTQSLSEDACSSLRKLKESDVRIIIAQFEEDSASEVFCCAHTLNMFGARYQWVVAGGGAAGWRLGSQVSGCAGNSVRTAADGSIRIQIRQLGHTNTPGVSGRTPQDYQDSYLRQVILEGSKVSQLHAFAYDAVWVAARALGQVMEAVKHREKYGSQRNVSVSEDAVHKRLLEAVKQTQFEGVTGPVSFRNGERMASIDLIQFQGSRGVLVGEFSTATQQLRLMNHLMQFKGPGPARDQTVVVLQRQHVSLLLYGIVSSAAAVTVLITLTVLCFRIICRKHWLQRWSGGPQDELLLLGVLLSSSSVLISGLDGAPLSDRISELLCSSLHVWLNGSELQEEAAEGEAEEQLRRLNQQLKSQTAQLDVQIETITMQLSETPESPEPDQKLQHLIPGQVAPDPQDDGVRSVTRTHVVQICAADRKSDGINSPEHVRRRLSVQLPILHHSYLPAIGGVSASSSSLFGSGEAFVSPRPAGEHDHSFLYT